MTEKMTCQMYEADGSIGVHQQGQTGVDAAIKRANKLPLLLVYYDDICCDEFAGVIVDVDAAREVPA
jgi:hypothetical protein